VENEGPQGPQEGQPEGQEVPQQPAIDPRIALELAAQQFGMTPEELESTARLQEENRRVYEENRKRQREIEQREARADALLQERQRYAPPPPTYDDLDPVTRKVLERLDRIDQREEQRAQAERAREENQRRVDQTARELDYNYKAVMRGIPVQNQVDQERFFAAMGEIYPTTTGALPEGITPEKAVFFTAKYLGLNVNGQSASYGQPRQAPPRDPRAQFVIPTQGGGQNGVSPSGLDFAAKRPGETPEQYFERRVEAMKAAGFNTPSLPDGTRSSSG
jgi:hypothetical protein